MSSREHLLNRTYQHLGPLHILVPLLVAILLLVALQYLKRHALPLEPALDCSRDNPLCVALGDLARDVSNLQYDLERQHIDKQTLPVLDIYLTNGALEKLYRKRRETLDKPGQIMLREDNDWVRASVIANDGGLAERFRTRLRLKGDWKDHFEHPTKLSFRFSVQGEGYIFGMKRFSIQHPNTRNFQNELLVLDEMRRWGILAPRYRFVDVRINEYPIGIMALEEHVSKELLESQRRREGPVVVVDEDPMWRQKDLNARSAVELDVDVPPVTDSHLRPNDLPVKLFEDPPYIPGSAATSHAIRASSLYRDFLDGRLPADAVFDLEQMARWWVLTNTWYGCHGVAYHNRRFYFNPTTNLLEPIAFDNTAEPGERADGEDNCDDFVALYLTGNPDFRRYVLDFSETLLAEYRSPEWQERFVTAQAEQLKLLALDDFDTRPVLARDLVRNLSGFLAALDFDGKRRRVTEKPRYSPTTYPEAPIDSHMRAFLYPSGSRLTLALKNLTHDPVEDLRITVSDGEGEPRVYAGPRVLPAYGQGAAGETGHIAEIDIDRAFTGDTRATIAYVFRGEPHETEAVTQFRGFESGYDPDFLAALDGRPGVRLDRAAKRVTFSGPGHVIDRSLELGKGWSVTLAAGTGLRLVDGATLRVRGPLYIEGTPDEPVTIDVSGDPDYRDAGAWGGIIVSQSAARSRIEHAVLRGAGAQNLANRQDYYGITGCLSFYESDVDIADSEFADMHCEDALNIVRADFTIRSTTIRGPRADGFDSDFSTGVLSDSRFVATGNDAVDVSGTSLKLEDVAFAGIGDKAVSVGEESVLGARRLDVNVASTGVASKDRSVAVIRDSVFANIAGSGLITYIKKSEYGSASIDCRNCTFIDTVYVATNQRGSEILIDGVPQPVTNFAQAHLVEAGFVTIE